MNDRKLAATAIAAAVLLVALGIAAAIFLKPAQAREVEPDWTWRIYPSDRTNVQAMQRIRLAEIKEWIGSIVAEREAEKAAAEQAALEAEEMYYEPYYEPVYYEPSYVQGDPDGLNSFVGVVDGPNGTIETAYSSNVLYHYRTSEWEPDEYGFYRTSDGYYVVASNEYEEGTVIETSRGEAMVLDGGCAEGYIDFYTNW